MDILHSLIVCANDGLKIADTGADHYLTVRPGTNLSANRTLTITTGDSDRTLTFTGDASISGTNTGDQDLSGYLTIASAASTYLTITSAAATYLTITSAASTYQPLDATLTALAGANWSANALPIGSGSDTVSQVSFAANTFPARASSGNLVAKTITDFGLSLVDDTDASTARSTLALGTAATANTGTSGTTIPFLDGTNTWSAANVFAFAGLCVQDFTTANHLSFGATGNTTGNRALTFNMNDANRTVSLSGNLTVPSAATVSGTNTGDQTSVSGNAGTATALQTARNIGGVSFDGTADIVPQTIQSVNEATDTTCFVLFITSSGSQSLQPKNNANLTFNSNTGAFGATTIELGGNTDTTLSRDSAGVLAVEGVTVALNSTSATHTAGTIELGAASDTTLSRSSAGVVAVEGTALLRASQNLSDVGSASTAWTNIAQIATQSDQETASSTTLAVTPGRQHFHPSAAKAWVYFDGTGTPAIVQSYKGSSITDSGTGTWVFNMSVTMSGTNFCTVGSTTNPQTACRQSGTTTVNISSRNSTGTLTDAADCSIIVMGDI